MISLRKIKLLLSERKGRKEEGERARVRRREREREKVSPERKKVGRKIFITLS